VSKAILIQQTARGGTQELFVAWKVRKVSFFSLNTYSFGGIGGKSNQRGELPQTGEDVIIPVYEALAFEN
jgi:hypothetical protein